MAAKKNFELFIHFLQKEKINAIYTRYAYCVACVWDLRTSLQNEADRSIFISKFVFVLVTKSTQQKPKTLQIFKNYMLRNEPALPLFDLPTSFSEIKKTRLF